MASWVPARAQRGELLDSERCPLPELTANLREMVLADRLLGGRRALSARVRAWIAALPADQCPRILDVATGNATFPKSLYRWSTRHGRLLQLFAGDINADVLLVARVELDEDLVHLVRYDALCMPFADGSFDIVTCSQALHHFDADAAARLLAELTRVARCVAIVNDLRRSYVAYWGARLLACGPVTRFGRHDGPLSVLRAYTPGEALELARRAGVDATMRRAPFRLLLELCKGDLPAAA